MKSHSFNRIFLATPNDLHSIYSIVEALVCSQDWVWKSRKPIMDNNDEILKDDEVAKALENAIINRGEKGKEPINISE